MTNLLPNWSSMKMDVVLKDTNRKTPHSHLAGIAQLALHIRKSQFEWLAVLSVVMALAEKLFLGLFVRVFNSVTSAWWQKFKEMISFSVFAVFSEHHSGSDSPHTPTTPYPAALEMSHSAQWCHPQTLQCCCWSSQGHRVLRRLWGPTLIFWEVLDPAADWVWFSLFWQFNHQSCLAGWY